MRCSQVQNLLPEYVEGALAATQQGALSAHLHACPVCAAEERSYQLAFTALNSRSKSIGAPDLWAAFSARLANELSCAEARELIPLQVDPALLAQRADALQSHLAACEPCEAESAMMGRAVAGLEAFSSRLPEVDLWPAFAARTGNAPARTSLFGSIRRAMSPGRNPVVAPILAMAAFAAILFGTQILVTRNPAQHDPTVAVETRPTPPPKLQPHPSPVAIEAQKPAMGVAKVSAPAIPPAKRRVRTSRTVALAVAAPMPKASGDAETVAKMTSVRPRGTMVAFDPGATPTADATLVSPTTKTDSNSDAAQEMVMPEVVQAVGLLLDFGDSTSDPFGGGQ
jgi:hypothetical protein